MSTDVIITRTNSIVYSARVRKIASSLKNNYRVRVVGWNREGIQKERRGEFVTQLDLLNFKAPFGRIKIVFYFPIFWVYLLAKLIRYQPSIVHACDLDTLPPSLIYKTLFKKKLVFDVCDRYAMSKIPTRNTFVYSFVNWLEEFLGQRADYMINVSEKMASTFKRKPRKTAIIMNCASDNIKKLVRLNDEVRSYDQKHRLILVYTGNIIRKRGLEQISAALKNIGDVQLIMAGKVIDQEFLDKLTSQENIKYCGQLPFPEALGLESIADVLVILYDPGIPNNIYANPNKLFEAMTFGIPVLTNVAEEIVQPNNCGVLVEYDNIELIIRSIIRLRDDPTLRKKLGENGRVAFEQKFNWSSMEKTLTNVYGDLLKTCMANP